MGKTTFSFVKLEMRLGQKGVWPKVWLDLGWQFPRKVHWGPRAIQGIYKARYVRLEPNVEEMGVLEHQLNDGRKLKRRKYK